MSFRGGGPGLTAQNYEALDIDSFACVPREAGQDAEDSADNSERPDSKDRNKIWSLLQDKLDAELELQSKELSAPSEAATALAAPSSGMRLFSNVQSGTAFLDAPNRLLPKSLAKSTAAKSRKPKTDPLTKEDFRKLVVTSEQILSIAKEAAEKAKPNLGPPAQSLAEEGPGKQHGVHIPASLVNSTGLPAALKKEIDVDSANRQKGSFWRIAYAREKAEAEENAERMAAARKAYSARQRMKLKLKAARSSKQQKGKLRRLGDRNGKAILQRLVGRKK